MTADCAQDSLRVEFLAAQIAIPVSNEFVQGEAIMVVGDIVALVIPEQFHGHAVG
jgi:hypothetical protein